MSETSSEVADVRAALEKAMEGTIGVKHPVPEVLDSAQAAAHATAKLLEATDEGERPALMEQLAEGLPGGLRAWLFELPSFLSKKKRPQSGHELCDVFAPLLGEAYLEAERNVVRYESGEVTEALAGIDACRDKYGDHPWILARGADLRERHGELRRARKDFEDAVAAARAPDANREDLRMVYDSFIQFLQDQGDQGTAVELSKQMLEEFPEIEEEFRTEQIVNEERKVGRNDPCPCGSGKKFKKCCGR